MSGQTMIAAPGSGHSGVLIVQSGPDSGKSFALRDGDNLIGREADCAVRLSEESVSRTHAMVRKDGDRFLVFDMGSRLGTRVDGESLPGHRITPGETIAMGKSSITLTLPGGR